jgi:membrane-associated phospholipid phosphatase
MAGIHSARRFAVPSAAAAVVVWVTLDVVTDGPLRAWDRAVIGVPAPAAGREPVGWRILVDIGGAGLLAIALLAAAVTHLVRRRQVRPVLVAGGWIVAIEATIWLAKVTIGRTPPRRQADLIFRGGMSFPSGHSADAVALLLIAAALVTTPGSRTAWVAAGTIPAVAAGVAVATVRLDYHWPTDAIAGWNLGLATGILAWRSLRRASQRHAR